MVTVTSNAEISDIGRDGKYVWLVCGQKLLVL